MLQGLLRRRLLLELWHKASQGSLCRGGGGRAAGNRLGMLLGRGRAGGPCVQESRGANWQADSGLGWQESQAREAAGCNWHESSGSEVREG